MQWHSTCTKYFFPVSMDLPHIEEIIGRASSNSRYVGICSMTGSESELTPGKRLGKQVDIHWKAPALETGCKGSPDSMRNLYWDNGSTMWSSASSIKLSSPSSGTSAVPKSGHASTLNFASRPSFSLILCSPAAIASERRVGSVRRTKRASYTMSHLSL